MPHVEFASSIRKHLPIDTETVPGTTVRAALESVFAQHGELRGYVLDDQGQVRKHVVIFVNNQAILDREAQSDAVAENDRLFVFQALSGG